MQSTAAVQSESISEDASIFAAQKHNIDQSSSSVQLNSSFAKVLFEGKPTSQSFVQIVGKPKTGNSAYQKKQTSLLESNDFNYAEQSALALSNQSNSIPALHETLENVALNTGELESLSPRFGIVTSPQSTLAGEQSLAIKSLQRLYASYPIRQTWFGGIMMNYYNISPEVSISKSQLPSAVSASRTGFELGTQVAKPISAKMDGFAMVSLSWNQYRAQFTKAGDSLTGIDQSQGADNLLVFAGRFTERTYQVNLRNVALQASGGVLFHQVFGGVGLRIGAGVSLAQNRNETSLLGGSSAGFSNSNVGMLAFAGFPFSFELPQGNRLRIEPTVQYAFRQPVTVPGVASMQPLQVGIRLGLE